MYETLVKAEAVILRIHVEVIVGMITYLPTLAFGRKNGNPNIKLT